MMNKRYIDFVPREKRSSSVRNASTVSAKADTTRTSSDAGAINVSNIGRTSQASIIENNEEKPITSARKRMFRGVGRRASSSNDDSRISASSNTVKTRESSSARVGADSVARTRLTEKVEPQMTEAPKFGIIEDYQPKFVKTDVKKRPLNTAKKTTPAKRVVKSSAETRTEVGAGKGGIGTASVDKRGNTSSMSRNTGYTEKGSMTSAASRINNARPDSTRLRAGVTTTPRLSGANALKRTKSPFVNTEKITKRPLSKNVYQKKAVVPKEEPSGLVTIIAKPEKDSKAGLIIAIILTIILGAAAGTVAFLLLPK